MSKYDEVMEKIVVTAEMKKRILSNLDKSNLKRDKKPAPFYLNRKFLSKLFDVTVPQEQVDVYGTAEAQSAEELSRLAGFDMENLTDLPFEVKETVYTSYGNGLAEILYIGDGKSLCYRKSLGTEDNSGDYNVYGSILEVVIKDISVTLKGNDDLFALAVWTDGSYAYSVSLTNGVSKDSFMDFIGGIW